MSKPVLTLEAQIRQIVDDALNSAIPEPWEVSEHAAKRIMALLPDAGWVLAPKEMTEEMQRAAENAAFMYPRDFARHYRAAIALASPADERRQP